MDISSLSNTVDAENSKECSSSLLNNNVSMNSSMDLYEHSPPAGNECSLPNLSFILTEEECNKLKQHKDLSINKINGNCIDKNQKASPNQTCFDESLMEESDFIVNIDDTINDEECSTLPVYFENSIIELGRRCWASSPNKQNYTKGCFWSPDGTCLLVPVHLDGMHVIELPLDLYSTTEVEQERCLSSLSSAVHVPEVGTVYDCTWYPHMNSQQPETCFWLASRQHEPIQMIDAFDGSQRCSYTGYDKVDEVEAAISLAFSADGQKIFAGYKKSIKIFDTKRPGRVYEEYPVKNAISCIAQTQHPDTVTCGNWAGYIQHFDLRCSPIHGPLFTLGGHSGGITQVKYAHHSADWKLFSGARKCCKLLAWDMRNYTNPLYELTRNVETNQRILFDLGPQPASWLSSGDTEGLLHLWNLESGGEEHFELPLHADCCNGVSFHPTLPILASSSGQYHFSDEQPTTTDDANAIPINLRKLVIDYENAVLLVWFGKNRSFN